MEKNIITEALSQVPELVENTKNISAQNKKILEAAAKAIEAHVKAEIPEGERQKYLQEVKDVVGTTPCATPDVSDISRIVADGIVSETKKAVCDGVRESLRDVSIPVKHQHVHVTSYELAQVAEKKAKNVICFLSVLCGVLLLFVGVMAYRYFTGETYWAKQYWETMTSNYSTPSERKMLNADIFGVAVLPNEFKDNPEYVIAKIRQNREVLKERKRQASTNVNGKYSTKVPLER